MSTYQDHLAPCPETSIRADALSGLSALWARLRDNWKRATEQRQRRRAFLHMTALDDRALDDIGLSRADVETAANLPLEINASLAVRDIARDRQASERRLRRR